MRGGVRGTLLLALLAFAHAGGAAAQVRATITGVVHDSIANAPLSGATVQLVGRESSRDVRTAIADSLGRFVFDSVPVGRHVLGFSHPLLDSLGFDPIVRAVDIDTARSVRADLAVPSPARIRAIVCGAGSDDGVILGIVRDARRGTAAPGVIVAAQWLDIEISATGIVSRRPVVADTSRQNGWFALCRVPRPGKTVLVARRGPDSTDRVEVAVPEHGFVRRDMYVGAADDSSVQRLTGTVVTMAGARPIADAQVKVRDVEVRTNERGEWTLPNARAGTRLLEARAVGYVPEQLVVDAVPGAPPVRVALHTMQAMLDTIKVTAARLSSNMRGFENRRRSGLGRFLTTEEIARRRVLNTTDLFRVMPWVLIEKPVVGPTMLYMRATNGRRCVPSFFLNGSYFGSISADEMDAFVNPAEIVGVEVYRDPLVPPQFSTGFAGCGSIVVWSQPPIGPRRRGSWKRRVLLAAAVAVISAGIWSLVY